MLFKQTVFHLLIAVLTINVVEGLWMPDCSKDKHKDKPQCTCKNPNTWDDGDVCEEFWNRPAIKETVDKMSKIVGGEVVMPRDTYPWFARLVRRNGSWWGCGGMLVAKEYVLTAAHCVSAGDAGSLAVQIGAVCPYAGDNCGEPIQQINVEIVTPHPQYNSNTLSHDFALLKLVSRANAEPVPMDQGEYVDNYAQGKRGLYAIGFGRLSSGGSSPSELHHVELAYVPRAECDINYNGGINDLMMCAKDPGQDSCQGDSGGPLYDAANNALVGVVSWGYGCADPNYPGVYAQVSTQWSWIQDNICNNHSNPLPSFCGNSPPTAPTPTAPTPTPPVGCDAGELEVGISVTTDNYPGENSWTLTSSNGDSQSSPAFTASGAEYSSSFCLDQTLCHTFTLVDTYGDGIFSNGAYSLTVDGSVLLSNNGSAFSTLTEDFGTCNVPPTPTAPTPTAPTPTAPTPTAPTPTATPPTSFTTCSNPDKDRLTLYLKTDSYGIETTVKVFKRRSNGLFNRQVFEEGPFENDQEYTFSPCLLKTGCYKIVVYDSYGDGMCCSYGNGEFQGYLNGEPIPNVDGVFDSGSQSTSEAFGNC